MATERNGNDIGLDPGLVRIRQRLRALRSRYPGTALTTELTQIHDGQVVVRAVLAMPDGSAVTAFAAEPIDDTGMLDAALGLAEQRATARALDLLGVGDFGTEGRRPAQGGRPPATEVDVTPAPVVEDTAEDDADDEPATAAEPPRIQSEEPVATGEGVPPEAQDTVAADDEPDMADYTWTHLWSWARAHGVTDRGQVDQRVGRPTVGLSPREIRALLIEAGLPE